MLLILGALLGYLLVMLSNPVHASFLDGWRAVRRYPRLAVILGTFGFGYALFQLGLRCYFASALPLEEGPLFWWKRERLWSLPPGALEEAARGAILPMLDSTAGLFNNLVSTFPLAAVGAALFLLNWGGVHGALWRSLRQRCGLWIFLIHPALLVCAVAAMAKPLLYAAPHFIDPQLWVMWAPIAAALAFWFEYLFGVGVQLYLLLLAYCWVRGLSFQHERLLDFTIGRFSSVLRWAAVVLVLSTLCIDLPLILQNVPFFSGWFPPESLDLRSAYARAALDLVFLACATVQITLTLHGESLRRSLRDHARFVWRHAWPLGWFILLAALHFYALQLGHGLLLRGLGDGSALWFGWSLLFPWLNGWAGAWLLAAWVSMFKRTYAGRLGAAGGVRF